MNSDEFNILRKLHAMYMCHAATVTHLDPKILWALTFENENIALVVFLSSGNYQLPFKFAQDDDQRIKPGNNH